MQLPSPQHVAHPGELAGRALLLLAGEWPARELLSSRYTHTRLVRLVGGVEREAELGCLGSPCLHERARDPSASCSREARSEVYECSTLPIIDQSTCERGVHILLGLEV